MFLSARFCCASQCVQVLVTEVAVHSIAGTEISSFISLVTGALQGDFKKNLKKIFKWRRLQIEEGGGGGGADGGSCHKVQLSRFPSFVKFGAWSEHYLVERKIE